MSEPGQSEHAQRVDAIHLQVELPRSEIYAELRHRDQVTITFGPGVYDFLSERSLEHAVGNLGRLLLTGWTRAYQATLDERIRSAQGVRDQRDRQFVEDRARIESCGTSYDERIVITARGLFDYDVSIADGTIRAIDEHEFAERLRDAVVQLVQDYMTQIRELQDRYYG